MRIAVDTNVLIRFFTEDDLVQNEIAARVLESTEAVFISTIVLCEAVWVLRRAYKYTPARVATVLSRLISIANVEVDTPAVEMGLRFLAMGGDFADGVILYEAKRAKADTLATFDADFANWDGAFILDLNRLLPSA